MAFLDYEPMFDSKQTLTERITNAIDLMIDFSTLGEYGMEPVGQRGPSCQTRRRPSSARPATRISAERGAIARH